MRLLLKACPRCHGDLFWEQAMTFDYEGLSWARELVCLQCGRRCDEDHVTMEQRRGAA